MDRAPRKTADEYMPAQIRESHTHFLRRFERQMYECCCHNQMLLTQFSAAPTCLPHDARLSQANAADTPGDHADAARQLVRPSIPMGCIRLADHAPMSGR